MLLKIDSVDVSSSLDVGVSVTHEVGQRAQGKLNLQFAPGQLFRTGSDLLVLADGSNVELFDGTLLQLPGGVNEEVPPFWAIVTLDHPGAPYRARVVDDLQPWLYWRLDDGLTTVARDARPGGTRHGTYSTSGVLQRVYEPPFTAVPYGAAPHLTDGTVTGPALDGLREWSALFWFRVEAGATGAADVLSLSGSGRRLRLRRTRRADGRHDLELRIVGTSVVATAIVDVGEWAHVAVERLASNVALSIDGVRSVSSSSSAIQGGETDGRTFALGAAGMDCDVDEFSIHNVAVGDDVIRDLVARRRYWRPFGGIAYAPTDTTDAAGGRAVQVKAVGFGVLLDRLHIEGVFASPTDEPAGSVLRSALQQGGYPYSSDGCDLAVALERVIARQTSLADLSRTIGERAVGFPWVDNWADVHLDTAGAIRHIPVDLTDEAPGRPATVRAGWTRRRIPTRWRTRTIVVGAGASGGIVPEKFVGDGSRSRWDLLGQVAEVLSLTVDGAKEDVGNDPADPWYLSDDDSVLRASVPPANGVVIDFEYRGRAPLVASAEDPVGLAEFGRVERLVEDDTLDTIALVQERAAQEQTAHGRPGLEVTAETKPDEYPLFCDVAGAPRVILGAALDQRMLLERMVTKWLPGGDQVFQSVTVRANDYSSDLGFFARNRRLTTPPPITAPVSPPISTVAVEGLALPVNLGGDYSTFEASGAWVDVPGSVRPILDGHQFADVRLVVSFMAMIDNWLLGQALRIRLWDHTRAVRIGEEMEVATGGALYRQQTGLILPPQRVQVGLQVRMLAGGGEAAVWGGTISAGLSVGQ